MSHQSAWRQALLLLICLGALTLVMAMALAFAAQYVRPACDTEHSHCLHAERGSEEMAT